MRLSRSAGHVLSISAVVGTLLYIWLRYFSTESPVSGWVGIFSFLAFSAGLYLFLSSEIPRRWRTPFRFLRWDTLLSVLGAAHAILWGGVSLLVDPASTRLYNLVTALLEGGVVLQAAAHLAIAGHLISFRVRPMKALAITGYFALTTVVLIVQNINLTIGTLLAPLLWVGILPLLYFSDWIQESLSQNQRVTETLALLITTIVILFIAWRIIPLHFLGTFPPLLENISFVLVAVVLLHGGWFVTFLLLRLISLGKGNGDSLELLTEFLARQQSSTSPQMVLETTKETLRRISSVGGALIFLRSTPEEMISVDSLSNAHLRETLRKLLLERSGTEAYIEFIPSLQKSSRRLPDVSVVLTQRPLVRLSGTLLNQTLSMAVVSALPDGFEERDVEIIKTLTEQTALFLENLDRRSYQEQLLTARKGNRLFTGDPRSPHASPTAHSQKGGLLCTF